MENKTIHFKNEVTPINNVVFNCPLVTEIARNYGTAVFFKDADLKKATKETTQRRIESMQEINDKIGGKWDELENAKQALEKFDEIFDQLSVSDKKLVSFVITRKDGSTVGKGNMYHDGATKMIIDRDLAADRAIEMNHHLRSGKPFSFEAKFPDRKMYTITVHAIKQYSY